MFDPIWQIVQTKETLGIHQRAVELHADISLFYYRQH